MEDTYKKVKRLLYLQKYFDLFPLIAKQQYTLQEIAGYYKVSQKLFYRIFASKQGFMHVGLSESGVYQKDSGYELYQLDIIRDVITQINAVKVLEIGCGQCANLKYLASRFPDVQFYGIDLLPNSSSVQKSNNIKVFTDDYHKISDIADTSIDLAFAVETMCYSSHKADVIGAVYKKLKKNGRFVVFDIFLDRQRKHLSSIDRIYLNIMENAYCLSPLEPYKEIEASAVNRGFEICEARDLSQLSMPYLLEIEERMSRYLRVGKLPLKLLLALSPQAVTRSMPPGILMRQMVQDGYLHYKYMQLIKDEVQSDGLH